MLKLFIGFVGGKRDAKVLFDQLHLNVSTSRQFGR